MEPADLALVLALDGSASVTFEEFGLIAGGLAAALRDPEVMAGLVAGQAGASIVAVLLWSGAAAQELLIDWTRIADEASARRFADDVENAPRLVRAGSTAIGEALAVCLRLLAGAPAQASRLVVDVAGDGRSNDGTPPGPVRDRMVEAGVTINGLCILHEEPDLLASYEAEVIGGPGAFAIACADYGGFALAMRQKLVREIS
jgi:hypothetical protein